MSRRKTDFVNGRLLVRPAEGRAAMAPANVALRADCAPSLSRDGKGGRGGGL